MIHTNPTFVLFFGLAALCALLTNTMMFIVIGKVNRMIENGRKISYLRWSMRSVVEQYRRFFPEGKLLFAGYGFGILTVVFLVVAIFSRR